MGDVVLTHDRRIHTVPVDVMAVLPYARVDGLRTASLRDRGSDDPLEDLLPFFYAVLLIGPELPFVEIYLGTAEPIVPIVHCTAPDRQDLRPDHDPLLCEGLPELPCELGILHCILPLEGRGGLLREVLGGEFDLAFPEPIGARLVEPDPSGEIVAVDHLHGVPGEGPDLDLVCPRLCLDDGDLPLLEVLLTIRDIVDLLRKEIG